MGKGIDLARKHSPELAAFLDDMKDQLLIVLLKELKARGHSLRIPVADIDGTGQDILLMAVDGRDFVFELRKKS